MFVILAVAGLVWFLIPKEGAAAPRRRTPSDRPRFSWSWAQSRLPGVLRRREPAYHSGMTFAASPAPEARPSRLLAALRLTIMLLCLAAAIAAALWGVGELLVRALSGYVQSG